LHPELASPLVLPAAGVVAGFAVLVIPRLIALVRSARETARFAAAVRSVTPVLVDGLAIRLLDIGAARAFSIGILRPVIVADLGLWASLSEQERRAVVHHENGHIERRDGLTLLVLRLLTALCPWTFGAPLMQGWRAAAERACDSHAARVLKDPMLVAEALITVERARAVSAQSARTPGLALGVGDCCCLDQRVRALLEEPQRAPELGNDLLALAILFIGALGLAIAWPGDAFHHAVETVLGLTIS
jgi:beta-lactamase regulating signal transducer with metallopeptidase domain